MFNVGGGELIVIALVALIVLGPDRLPGAMRTAGQWMSEIRRISSSFQTDFKTALADAERDAEQSKKAEPGAPALDASSAQAAAPMAPIPAPEPRFTSAEPRMIPTPDPDVQASPDAQSEGSDPSRPAAVEPTLPEAGAGQVADLDTPSTDGSRAQSSSDDIAS